MWFRFGFKIAGPNGRSARRLRQSFALPHLFFHPTWLKVTIQDLSETLYVLFTTITAGHQQWLQQCQQWPRVLHRRSLCHHHIIRLLNPMMLCRNRTLYNHRSSGHTLEWQSSNRVIRNRNLVISNPMQRGKWRFLLRLHCRTYSATSMGVSNGAAQVSRVCAEKPLNILMACIAYQ